MAYGSVGDVDCVGTRYRCAVYECAVCHCGVAAILYGPVAVSIDTGDVVMPLKLLVEPVVLYPQVLTVSAAGEPLPLAGMVLPSLLGQ